MNEKRVRRVYRLPPCPDYDIEGIESWLGDMAETGLFLSRDGFFLGFAIFERGEARQVRYRLDVAPRKTGWLSDDTGPDEEERDLGASFGWEYVASFGQFYIYRTEDANARELHTDPQVQALAINQIRHRERGSVVTSLLLWLVWPFIYLNGTWLLVMFEAGTWFVLIALFLLLWACAGAVARAVHFRRMRKKLLRGEALDHGKKWRRRAVRHRISSVLSVVCCLAWILALLCLWAEDLEDAGKIPLETYTGDLPFATIADLIPEGRYALDDIGFSNTVEFGSDWLAPSIIHWAEIATVTLPDGRVFSGGLYVDYYETASPWLAREAARELTRAARHSKYFSELEMPELDVSYAQAYSDMFPKLILQEGNLVVQIEFYQTSEAYELPLSEWAQRMVESLF